MNKRTFLPFLLLFALALSACQPKASPAAASAQTTEVSQGVVVQGSIQPVRSIDLAFNATGRVTEVVVDDGQDLEAGQVIARLGGKEARQADLARALAELSAAEQSLKDLADGAGLNAAQMELRIVEAQKAVDNAQKKLDDLNTLLSPDENELAEAEARLKVAQAELQAAKDHAANLNEGVDAAVLTAAKLRRDTAETSVTAAQAGVDALDLRSPLAGKLVGLDLQPGQFVTAGQPVGAVADFSSWRVQTDDLTELEVVHVSLGQEAKVILDALPESTMSAEIIHIAERFEEKRGDVTYTVTLALKDPAEALRWGMTGQISFVEKQ
jgi:multidrug resistance efflux pump